ncbi:MAG TPA: translation initiation factor IF-2 subunit beta [Thermoplasmatales archaeon]|nr:translation initiation factor IF-2 subunit beta [Thermoplasmatales archaeon]
MGIYDYKTLLKRVHENPAIKTKEVEERFTVPIADVFYEGRTTIIRNFERLASDLNREPEHVLKFLLGELGTAGERDGPRAVFQGKIAAQQIQNKIQEYVETYVLCQECGRPDTHIVKKDRMVFLRCDACGAFRSISTRKRKIVQKTEERIEQGKIYEVTISDIGKKGDGLAHLGKYTIYIPSAVKGSTVKVKIEKVSGTVAFGRIVS